MDDKLSDIRMHIYKCKHYSGYSPQCFKKSGRANVFHINICCNGQCTRMTNYCKKHGISKEMLEKAV